MRKMPPSGASLSHMGEALHSSLVFSFLFPCSFLLFSTVGIIVYSGPSLMETLLMETPSLMETPIGFP